MLYCRYDHFLNLPSAASFHGDINILLVGYPGTGKSQLQSPSGICIGGRVAQLLASLLMLGKILKQGKQKSFLLLLCLRQMPWIIGDFDFYVLNITLWESGALGVRDRHVCYDKVMEQQTFSIEKAETVVSLNTWS